MVYLVIAYCIYQMIGILILWKWCYSGQPGTTFLRDTMAIGLKIIFLWPLVLLEEVQNLAMRSEKKRHEIRIAQLEAKYAEQERLLNDMHSSDSR